MDLKFDIGDIETILRKDIKICVVDDWGQSYCNFRIRISVGDNLQKVLMEINRVIQNDNYRQISLFKFNDIEIRSGCEYEKLKELIFSNEDLNVFSVTTAKVGDSIFDYIFGIADPIYKPDIIQSLEKQPIVIIVRNKKDQNIITNFVVENINRLDINSFLEKLNNNLKIIGAKPVNSFYYKNGVMVSVGPVDYMVFQTKVKSLPEIDIYVDPDEIDVSKIQLIKDITAAKKEIATGGFRKTEQKMQDKQQQKQQQQKQQRMINPKNDLDIQLLLSAPDTHISTKTIKVNLK